MIKDFTVNNDKKSVTKNEKGDTIESVVYTDPAFAKKIIDYLEPQFNQNDKFLDPCRGSGAFYDHLPDNKDYCELMENKDFHNYNDKVNWIITNPPWGGRVYAPFANKCFEQADNVVFLVKLFGAIGTNRRLRDAENNNMFLKEIIICDWKQANFKYMDGSAKAGEGFVLSIVHWQKNHNHGTVWTNWVKDKSITSLSKLNIPK